MALVLADRVKATTTTTGTGAVSLGASPTGFQSFAAVGDGNTTYYAISGGAQWEVGVGTYTAAGPSLSRDTVLSSSSANALVNFSAGTKEVFVTLPAAQASGGISYTRFTANTTASDKDGIIADTSGGIFTVTLPAAPETGAQVAIVDGANWATNNLTVARNGSTIEGLAEDLVLDIGGVAVHFIYDGTTWEVFTQAGAFTGAIPANAISFSPVGGVSAADVQAAIAELDTEKASLTGTQTLTNKTLNGAVLNDGYTEEVFTLGTSGSVALSSANGSIQTCAASGTVTLTDSLAAGQSIVLMLTNGDAQTINWPTTTWVSATGNAAPTLTASDVLVFWKVSTTLYGAYVGSGA
jgi:hypothetical protein